MVYTPKNFPLNDWLVKTNFSFLKGASHPAEIISTANACGYKSICINDFNGVYGLARTYNDLNFLKKNQTVKLKLNYGAELNLRKDHDDPLLNQVTIVLNIKSSQGFLNLNKIISHSHRESKNEATIAITELTNFDLKDIFVIIPMRGGLKYFLKNQAELRILKELFNKNLYFAVTKTLNHYADSLIEDTYELSNKFEIERIFSQDIFFAHRSEKSFHDVLTAIRLNKIIQESAEHFFPNGERSLHTKETYYKIFSPFKDFNQVITRMDELNDSCEFCLSQIKYEYPKEFIENGYTAQTFLEKVTWLGAKERFGAQLPAKIVDSIAKELDLIENLGFADYFLTVWDIVRWARSQAILCQGRGSAANSAVCYVLGVTSCDPTLFDLLFERFISKERGDPPDIDIDFEHERREEVIQYIYRRYGRKRAAMVANVITFRSKSAVRSIGKAFGVDEKTLKNLSESIGAFVNRGKDIGEKINSVDVSKKINLPNNLTEDLWTKLASRLIDFPRHLGVHSGGFIISQHEISELVAQEPATMEGRTVIQWSKDDIEELGFFKIDCLALGMLTAISKCFKTVKECYGHDLSLYDIPNDDQATYSMIQKAKTEGTFQIESRAQMSMLPRLKPKCFYDLVIEIAIIRPGPIQGHVIHPYLRRRDGLDPVVYPHDSVKEILSKTLGIIIFQEQLMRIAITLGDFTPGEADSLRKQIGMWNSKAFNRDLDPCLEKLTKGMKKRKIKSELINQAFEQMKGFAHYGFPESHAISFAYIAYASCYLKCHYPAAFYISVMNSQPMGFYSPHALLQSAKREGIKILPVSVNHSEWDHTLELIEHKADRPKQYAIRLGLRIVSGLSHKAVEEVLNARRVVREFKNFDQFVSKTNIFRDDYTAIAAANGFHCLGIDRFDALWLAEAVPFKNLIDVEERKLKWKKINVMEKTQLDFSSFGTSLEIHPVQIMREKYWAYSFESKLLKKAIELENMPPQNNVNVFGMTLIKQAPPSAKGMVFYTLEDETGFINLAFTPQVYTKYHKIIERSGFVCVKGKLQKVAGYHSILVGDVYSEDRGRVLQLRTLERDKKVGIEAAEKKFAYEPRSFR